MTDEINLLKFSAEAARESLFHSLDVADPGTELTVIAEDDLDPALVQYQLDRQRVLTWSYHTPDEKPRELSVTVGNTLESNEHPSFDVRDRVPQRRHRVLTELFNALATGEGFVFINDHDPKPLYHELRSRHGESVEWSYEQEGNGEWRVCIEKTDGGSPDASVVETTFDLREIPAEEHQETVQHRFGMLPHGATMELIDTTQPESIRQHLINQYGADLAWSLEERADDYVRVHVTKPERDEASAEIAVRRELDVRDRPPAERHERIFEAYEELDIGEGFVLVNDHDPKPLYHQFEAEAGPEFRWRYRQKEPGEFRVLIGKGSGDSIESPQPDAQSPF